MRFEVPQFIEIEDKIFGPLTWRQFVYVGGGVGFGVTLFLIASFPLFLFLGLPVALLAGALAFYPVNNRPFSFFLQSMVNYVGGTKLYIWRRKDDVVYRGAINTEKIPAVPVTPPLAKNFGRPSLARRLELEAIQKTE